VLDVDLFNVLLLIVTYPKYLDSATATRKTSQHTAFIYIKNFENPFSKWLISTWKVRWLILDVYHN